MAMEKVASRYAQALLDLSVEQKIADEVSADMKLVISLCSQNSDFAAFLRSPIVAKHEKSAIFQALFDGKVTPLSARLFQLVSEKSRENILPDIAQSFVQLYKKYKGVLEVRITSATPLEQKVIDKIAEKVQQVLRGTTELQTDIDPSLLGGFVVRVDDQQIDASVAHQLGRMKHVLLH